jgi:hypothetical protein
MQHRSAILGVPASSAALLCCGCRCRCLPPAFLFFLSPFSPGIFHLNNNLWCSLSSSVNLTCKTFTAFELEIPAMSQMPTVAGAPKPARMGNEARFVSNDGVDLRGLSFGHGLPVSLATRKLERYRMLMLLCALRVTSILAADTARLIISAFLITKPLGALLAQMLTSRQARSVF